jgi:hypothetical protein
MTYILIDSMNTFFRARHVIRGDLELKIDMSIHIMLASMRKAWNLFSGHHVIFCLDGSSWRKEYYSEYKKPRVDLRKKRTVEEKEQDDLFFNAYNKFISYIKENTNCTVLYHPALEADDLIAGWIQKYPDDNHVVISSDSDFLQLLSANVSCYNGVTNTYTTIHGFYDDKNKEILDKKTGKKKQLPDPEWILFEKCIRGDPTDNVFSAYPMVRKTKLLEAFRDRNAKGYAWNNLMLQKFIHHDGTEHRVLDDYNRNKQLIDLTAQPDHIRSLIDSVITENSIQKNVGQVGTKFLKFCGSNNLQKLSEEPHSFSNILNSSLTILENIQNN